MLITNYNIYTYYAREADSAWRHYYNTSRARYFTKRERKREAERLSSQCNNYYSAYYYSGVDPINKTLLDYIKKRNDLNVKRTALNGISSVKDLSTLKEYIGEGTEYNLSMEDLSHLYDTTSEGFTVTGESINLNSLRKEVQRVDIDGDAVKAVYRNGKVTVLDKDGKEPAGNSDVYDITNPGISLKFNGEDVETFEEGKIYDLYDRNFNIKEVTGVMKDLAKQKREEYYRELMAYVQKSAADGKHDYTVMLRDLESTFHGLQQFAVSFNFDKAKPDGEKRQRGFDGYISVTEEYLNNGRGTSIQDLIVKELMHQNTGYQEKNWAEQMEKFKEREIRWREVTGYIINRGNRDWRMMETDFINQWKKWRIDTKREIEDGERWWEDRDAEIQQQIKQWSEETSGASSKAAAEKIYGELTGKIEGYEKNLKNSMPGKDFDVGTEKILSNTMRSLPLDSIEILSRSMFSTDTTAGFTEMLNLGVSSALYKYNEQKMTEYREAVGVMKNLQVIDILNGIIEGFNKQLAEANDNVYESFGGFATGRDMINTPWIRNREGNFWSIRVCVESTLKGDKYKTRWFSDYNRYINKTVFLEPLKGLYGTTIDFTSAGSYTRIDGGELETYLGLESDILTRKIEEVFKNPEESGNGGGLFSGHVNSEQERLGAEFEAKYTEWMEGEAMKGLAAWNKPIGHGAPSVAVAVNIGAQVAGGVIGYVAGGSAGMQLGAAIGQLGTGMVFTSLDVADQTVSWEHAGAQMGTGFLNAGAGMFSPLAGGAMQGIEYKENGGLGWSRKDFEAGIKGGAKDMLVRSMTGNFSGISDMASSWVDTDGGWGEWGFDNSHWGDHIMAGVGGCIGAAGLPGQGGEGISELLRFTTYHALNGHGFRDSKGVNEGQYNWDIFKPDASHTGSSLFKVAQLLGKKDGAEDSQEGENSKGEPGSDTSDPLQQGEDMLSGWWLSNKSWDENVSDIFGRIADNIRDSYEKEGVDGVIIDGISAYAGFIVSSAVSEFNETVQGWADAAAGFGRIGNAIGNAWSSAVETVGGWFGGNKIAPADLPKVGLTPEQYEHINKAERLQKFRELEEQKRIDSENNTIVKSDNYKAVINILEKQKEGKDITQEDITNLMKTMLQNGDSPTLPKELYDTIMNDPDAFKKLFNMTIDFKKDGKATFDITKPGDIQKFSQNLSHVFCKIISTYTQLVANGIENVPPSIGEFFKLSIEKGWIKPETPARQSAEVQTIVDELAGKGKYQVYFFGLDKNTNGGNLKDMLANTAKTNQEIKLFTLYINSPHGMSVYNNSGKPVIVDSSSRGFNYPYHKIEKSSVTAFWYLVKKNNSRR